MDQAGNIIVYNTAIVGMRIMAANETRRSFYAAASDWRFATTKL